MYKGPHPRALGLRFHLRGISSQGDSTLSFIFQLSNALENCFLVI
jgi:hypothetical protein